MPDLAGVFMWLVAIFAIGGFLAWLTVSNVDED